MSFSILSPSSLGIIYFYCGVVLLGLLKRKEIMKFIKKEKGVDNEEVTIDYF